MNDEELLAELKREMILAAARAYGTRLAWEQKLREQADEVLRKRGIRYGDRLCVSFTNGDQIYVYRRLEVGYGQTEPSLAGIRVLKSGKLANNGDFIEKICKLSYLCNVKKVEKPAAKPRATKTTAPRTPTSTQQP